MAIAIVTVLRDPLSVAEPAALEQVAARSSCAVGDCARRHVAALLGADGRSASPLRVVGVIVEPPRYGRGSATLVVRATALDNAVGQPLAGLVRVRIQHCSARYGLGDRIAIRSTLRAIENFGNPGEFDWAAWNHRRGIAVSAFAWSDRDVVVLDADGHARTGLVVRLRREVRAMAAARADAGSAFVAAVTVGDRGGLDAATVAAVRDAGMAHALAISGLHVGLLAGACLLAGRQTAIAMGYVAAGRDAVLPACVAALIAVVAYAALGGGGVSVFRAVTMGVASLWVLALAGRGRPLEVLGIAAAVLGLAAPGVATEPGFQLSFAATAALIALTSRQPSRVAAVAAVPVLAWLVTAPIVAQHFQRVSLVAPLVNLAAAPLVSVTVLLGLLSVASLGVSQALAQAAFTLASGAASLLLRLCEYAAAVDWAAVDVVSPGVALTSVLSALPVCALYADRRRWWVPAATACAAGLLVWLAAAERYRDDRLDVHFVSVGQGDSTIVKLPGGKIAVVDGGRPGRGLLAVGPWLGRLHVGRIDYLIATHVQADHWGGLVELAERFEIGEFWHNGGDCDVDAFAAFVGDLRRRGVGVVDVAAALEDGAAVERRGADGSILRAIGPSDGAGSCDANDRSVVLSVRYGGHGVLLAGDLEAAGEQQLIARHRELAHTVLKAPHHASRTSSTPAFLDAVDPRLAVAGCGAGNRYGFPHEDVVVRYRDRGVRFLSTDRWGAVSLRIDADGIRVDTAKKL